MDPVMSVADLEAFVAREFTQVQGKFRVTAVAPFFCTVEMDAGPADLRPGGTVSGPSMFALVDCAYYFATLAMIGPQALTVTTHLSIDFMRKPVPGLLRAEARILKLGRSLSVGHVLVFAGQPPAGAAPDPVAQASVTYAIPPVQKAGPAG
ncbi:MAG: PaaI family thioesterase [Pseudomonadota bacterium]